MTEATPEASPVSRRAAAAVPKRRYELCLTDEQREAWRAIAERQGVSLADVVRWGVKLVGDLPPGAVRAGLARIEADRAAAAVEVILGSNGCVTGHAIRDASRGTGPGMPSGDIAPLSTRGAR